MQASRITLGGEYAVNYGGKLRRLRAVEIVTTRDSKQTTNKVGGYIDDVRDDDGHLKLLYYEVANILDEANKYDALMKEKQAIADAAKAKEDARLAKQRRAILLLTKAIGVPAIVKDDAIKYGSPEYRRLNELREGPHIAESYSGLDVDPKAYDALIAYFEQAGVTLDEEVAA